MLVLKLIGFLVFFVVVFVAGNRIGCQEGYKRGHKDGRKSLEREVVVGDFMREIQAPNAIYFTVEGEWTAVVRNAGLGGWQIITFQSNPDKSRFTQQGMLLGKMSPIP